MPADIGVETGIFKKHGLDVEISSFGGDAKMMQALAADGIDIALGGGPAFATIVKGSPMKAVAALANAPNTIMLVVLKDGPIKTVADLKDKKVSVSTAGSLTYWLTMQLSRSQGLGQRRHQDHAARRRRGTGRGAQDPPGRRRDHRQRHRLQARRGGQRPHPGEVRRHA